MPLLLPLHVILLLLLPSAALEVVVASPLDPAAFLSFLTPPSCRRCWPSPTTRASPASSTRRCRQNGPSGDYSSLTDTLNCTRFHRVGMIPIGPVCSTLSSLPST